MFGKKITLLMLPFIASLSLQANDPFDDDFFKDPFGDEIFKEMMQMQKNMDEMFDRMQNRMQQRSSGIINPLGSYKISQKSEFVDKGDHYELLTDIPENKENQIEINAKDSVLSITAKIIEKKENKSSNSYSSSSAMQMYQQSLPLPKDADEGTLKASYKDTKLVITIDKKTGTQTVVPNIKANDVKKEKIEQKKSQPAEEGNTTKNKITINSDIHSMS